MRTKGTEFPSHLRDEKDFPSDYKERLRRGSAEDRKAISRDIIDTFPVRNIGAFVELLARTYGDRIAIREPPVKGEGDERVLTYVQLAHAVDVRAHALLRLGVQHGERIGIVSENNIDALVLKLACERIGAIVLPWTERIEEAGMTTAEAMERAHVPWLALNKERSVRHVLEADPVDFPHIDMLKSTRHMIGVTDEDDSRIADAIGTPPVRTVEQSESVARLENVGPSDTAFIFYSPGTGGLSSKMVEVSHANMLYQYCVTPGVLRAPPGTRYLHILPPYHIFGETMLGMVLSMGGEVTLTDLRRFIKGDGEVFKKGEFQILAAIPDFWHYLRLTIEKKLPGFVQSALAEDMIRVAGADIARARRTGDRDLIDATDAYWKPFLAEYAMYAAKRSSIQTVKAGVRSSIAHLLYPVVRKKAGVGSLRWGISGGAKLLPEDYAFFSALRGTPEHPEIELHSGYGLTEAGVCSISSFGEDSFAASVGDIVPGSAAWTEKTSDGHKEICIAGPGVARYRDAELQQELVPGGVLHTGDQGDIIEIKDRISGKIRTLLMHGRQLKRMIKWKGASMLPAPMEDILKESPLINDALVVGNGQDRLGVLIFSDHQAVREYCMEHPIDGFDPTDPDWDHPGIRKLFQKEVESRMRITVTKQRAKVDSFRLIGEVPPAIRMASGIIHPRKTEEHFAQEIADLWQKQEFAIEK